MLTSLLAGFAGCSAEPAPERQRSAATVAVVPYTVQLLHDDLRIEAVGTSRARVNAVLFPETGGEVVEVLFQTGDYVEAGTPLVRFEAIEENLAVRLATIEVRNAEQLLARYRRIEGTGAVSDSQIDEAQTAVDAARIALDQAQLALAERTVTAPFAGYLGLTNIDAGARITTTTEIAQLDDRRTLYVDFSAPEEVFERIAVGDVIAVAPFANAGTTLDAQVIGLDSRIDSASRAFTVRAKLDNGEDRLRPGMSFRVFLTLQGPLQPAVPEAAVLWGTDGPYLWRLEEDLVRRAVIEIIARKAGYVLVRGDVEAGAQIVLEGIQKVREGTRVVRLEAASLNPRQQASSTLTGGSE